MSTSTLINETKLLKIQTLNTGRQYDLWFTPFNISISAPNNEFYFNFLLFASLYCCKGMTYISYIVHYNQTNMVLANKPETCLTLMLTGTTTKQWKVVYGTKYSLLVGTQ